jgi:peptidoglycan/LPS O-acetylase OafA/YrhL
VNESVWEHLKLLFWPGLAWWLLGYFLYAKQDDLPASKWLFSAAAGLFAGPLFIAAFFYTYTGAFGFHSLFLDILSFLLGTAVAQLSGLFLYSYIKTARSLAILAVGVLILVGALFIIFTFSPPQIPLFEDPVTGNYGI